MSFCSLFIGLEHIHVTLKYTNILGGGGRGGGGEGCLVALRKMLQVARYCNPAAEKNYSIRGDDKYICEDSSLTVQLSTATYN